MPHRRRSQPHSHSVHFAKNATLQLRPGSQGPGRWCECASGMDRGAPFNPPLQATASGGTGSVRLRHPTSNLTINSLTGLSCARAPLTQTGNRTITITFDDSFGDPQAVANFPIMINAAMIITTSSPLPDAKQGVAYLTLPMTATGGRVRAPGRPRVSGRLGHRYQHRSDQRNPVDYGHPRPWRSRSPTPSTRLPPRPSLNSATDNRQRCLQQGRRHRGHCRAGRQDHRHVLGPNVRRYILQHMVGGTRPINILNADNLVTVSRAERWEQRGHDHEGNHPHQASGVHVQLWHAQPCGKRVHNREPDV